MPLSYLFLIIVYCGISHICNHVRVNKTFSFLGLLFFSSYDYGTHNVKRSGDGRYPWLSLGLKGKDYSIKDDICSSFAFIYAYIYEYMYSFIRKNNAYFFIFLLSFIIF